MEPTATAGTDPSAAPPSEVSGLPGAGELPAVAGLLDGMPRQRGGPRLARASGPAPAGLRSLGRLRRLLPTPAGTPFTFGYAAVLALTSLFSAYAAAPLVLALRQASSTDVAHLLRSPAVVLLASALWIAGGLVSPFVGCFLLVLTALERRIGGARTAVVFLAGHVLATVVTEGVVGLAVLAGHLPGSSLHRLDYGISFGVAAGVGALAGLLRPWLRLPVLLLFGGMQVQSLLAFTDPMTNWGHLTALATGIATWPLVRRWHRETRARASWT
ncbi:rhomboid-like protein [Streptomyces sediminimaris]|uniref:rhomboid-like protein n=1 Tax=Streptomyces sediminimaris TaxID=3383721 RepID=UPI00399AA00E